MDEGLGPSEFCFDRSLGLGESMSDYDYSLHYRFWHDNSSKHAEEMRNWNLNLLGPLIDDSRGIALDIGCGMGFTMMTLSEMGFAEVVGIDRDKSQIAEAKQRGARVFQTLNTVEWLTASKQRFDLITMLDVLEHIPVDEQLAHLRAVKTALSPSGMLIVTVPNANSPIASRYRYIDFTHHTSFTEHSLRFVLLNAGFTRVDLVPEDPLSKRPPLKLWRPDRRVGARRWLVRAIWRQVLLGMLGEEGRVIPIEPNLVAVARP